MEAFITTAVLGIIISALGIMNMKGNISSLHWYHRYRVTEADRKPFGKLVGLGTLMIGVAMILFGGLYYIFELTQIKVFVILATIELIAAIVAGLSISFYAMFKYNKGIF